MKSLFDTKEYRDYKIEIYSDYEWGMCPRENFGYSSRIVTAHKRVSFDAELPLDADSADHAFDLYLDSEYGITIKDVIWLPVYMYEHGGYSFRTGPFSCGWDSGLLGFIYETKENIRKEYKVIRISKKLLKQIEDRLEGEIELLDTYHTEGCYWYSATDANGDVVGSCSGFYGFDSDENGLMYHATNDIDCAIESERKGHLRQRKEHFKQLKNWIRNKVPMANRYQLPEVYI